MKIDKLTFFNIDECIKNIPNCLFISKALDYVCAHKLGQISEQELNKRLKTHVERFIKAYVKVIEFKEENKNADTETLKKVFMDEYLKGEQDDNK